MLISDIRSQFPIFSEREELVYLDNAATTQRLESVITVMDEFYRKGNANIHRGVYDLSARATQLYEESREDVAKFIGARSSRNIGFTRGTTESINIVARSFLQRRLTERDNVVITITEHHANFIPWQQVCAFCQAELRVVPIDESGHLDMKVFREMVDENTRMVAVTHISNTLGSVNPISDIINIAHSKGAQVLIDAAQSAALYPLEVEKNAIDFLAFSGHKIFGPFGTGILYVNDEYRKDIAPFSVGGGMIKQVTVENTEFQEFPFNLESGTPNVAGFIGLKEAVNFLMKLDRESVREEMYAITDEVRKRLNDMDNINVIGPMDHVSSIISFNADGVHPHDAATFLNAEGIAVRAGMHCTQPLLSSLELPGTIRASFSMYNTKEEGDKLVKAVEKMCEFWA